MVTPTRDEIRAKALERYMEESYRVGLKDIPTPEDDELKEANFWLRAQRELMTGPEAKEKDELLKFLEYSASELEEVVVESEDLKKLLDASRNLESVEERMRELKRRRKKEKEQAKLRIAELEKELAEKREKPPPVAPPVKSYDELQREFEGKEVVDALAAFTSGYKGLKREYRLEDLNRFLRELRAKLTFEDLQRFYKVYPGITNDFVVFVASSIGWIPQPPLVTGLTDDDKRRLEDLFKRTFIEAGASYIGKLPAFRDELRKIQDTVSLEPHVAAVKIAERDVVEYARRLIPYKPPPPTPVPVPVAVVPVRVVIVEDRVRKLQERKCIACRGAFVIDLDLKKRVTEETAEIRGRGRVHRATAILQFPERFYHMCPNCRWTRFGYASIYDALAYLLAEAKRSSYKKVTLTKDKLRAVGLNKADLNAIQTIEARYRVSR